MYAWCGPAAYSTKSIARFTAFVITRSPSWSDGAGSHNDPSGVIGPHNLKRLRRFGERRLAELERPIEAPAPGEPRVP